MNAYEIVKSPIITEKTTNLRHMENVYTFEVDKRVNKIQVKTAIEEIFNVKVERVNLINVKSKTKKLGKHVGKTRNVKKALVKLSEGSKIEIL